MSVDLKSPEAQAVLGRLIAEEAARNEAEIAQQRQAAQQAISARDARERQAINGIAERMQAAAPLYKARDEAARALLKPLAEYIGIELQRRAIEYQAQAGVSFSGADGLDFAQRLIFVRNSAGLPARTDQLNLDMSNADEATRTARAALLAILAGAVGPDWCAVGGNVINFSR